MTDPTAMTKPSKIEAARLVWAIKQEMSRRGIVRPDVATKHLPEPLRSAVIHGIAHGTNTLGFKEMTR